MRRKSSRGKKRSQITLKGPTAKTVLGWMLSTAVKMLIGMPISLTGLSGFKPWLYFQSSFQLTHTLGRQQTTAQSSWVPTGTHLKEPHWIPGSWFGPGPAQLLQTFWEWTNRWGISLTNKTLKIHKHTYISLM